MRTVTPPHPWPSPIDLYVGERIRSRRSELRVSQSAVAKALGVTYQQMQKYERAANRVSASALVPLAKILEVAPGYFLDGAPGAPQADPGEAQLLATVPGAIDVARCLAAEDPAERVLIVNSVMMMCRRTATGTR